ncbi:MAG: type II CRISPR RNA-guided endonuclease Cas9, partial [Acidobacteria bacterium]|nr:type II CRISPR RNA-guided endonuclease Cas9 [Acidobacteriota bacterium]
MKILGLDIGIASIGFCLLENNRGETPKILSIGVRVFPQAENPKNGKSLAKPRRDARLARRRIQRKARRLKSIRKLFVQYQLIHQEEKDSFNKNITGKITPWHLRKLALNQILNGRELAICL